MTNRFETLHMTSHLETEGRTKLSVEILKIGTSLKNSRKTNEVHL